MGHRLAVVGALTILCAARAHADDPNPDPLADPVPPSGTWYQPAPDSEKVRKGSALQAGVGGAYIAGVDGSDHALSFDVKLGLMIKPRFMAAFELGATGHSNQVWGELEYGYAILGGAAQYWANDRLWLAGSVAVAWLSEYGTNPGEEQNGFAVGAQVGYEVLHSKKKAMDLALRAGTASFGDITIATVALTVGVGWYGAD